MKSSEQARRVNTGEFWVGVEPAAMKILARQSLGMLTLMIAPLLHAQQTSAPTLSALPGRPPWSSRLSRRLPRQRKRRLCTVGLNWYPEQHNLKVQVDYSYVTGASFENGQHQLRLQSQVYF